MCNLTEVTFSHDLLIESQKIDRDGAAQITIQNLAGPIVIINNNISLETGGIFKEDINTGEVSKTEYHIKIPANGRALLTRKFYICNHK